MKIFQVPFCCHPDPVGGTEVYVESLSRHLQHDGLQPVIVAPARESAASDHDGLPVRRFATATNPALHDLYGEGDPVASANFEKLLDQEAPDLVHLHAFTSAVSLRLVRAAKRRRIPVVFTYHTPTVSCQRGTLMRWGSETCDGDLATAPCVACAMQGKGLARPLAKAVAALPAGAMDRLASWSSGRPATVLRMKTLVQLRQRCFYDLMSEVDHVVAVCQWVRDLLRLNGVPESKVTLSRQGLSSQGSADPQSKIENPKSPGSQLSTPSPWGRGQGEGQTIQRPLRIVFLGRLDSSKGIHILIEAFRRTPDLNATLHIYGAAQGKSGEEYEARLKAAAANDSRIDLRAPVPASSVVQLLSGYDVLAVPSQVRETGPLVVLEAFAAGIPVIGSNLGGVAELVQDGRHGLLIDPGSSHGWSSALARLANDPSLVGALRRNLPAPRSMAEVAADMMRLYHQYRVAKPLILEAVSPH
jgi:glycosyltransferase involved in cell wall biosynthesis